MRWDGLPTILIPAVRRLAPGWRRPRPAVGAVLQTRIHTDCRSIDATMQTKNPLYRSPSVPSSPRRAVPAHGLLCLVRADWQSHPILKGDREFLRALRAAEMAAWESARPATQLPQPAQVEREAHLTACWARRLPGAESLLFLVLAGCAAAALLQGLLGLSDLATGWSRFTDTVRFLLS